jgi:hypothetical protein
MDCKMESVNYIPYLSKIIEEEDFDLCISLQASACNIILEKSL